MSVRAPPRGEAAGQKVGLDAALLAIDPQPKSMGPSTAHDQLLEYRADLDNPPLLVVCDRDNKLCLHGPTGVVN